MTQTVYGPERKLSLISKDTQKRVSSTGDCVWHTRMWVYYSEARFVVRIRLLLQKMGGPCVPSYFSGPGRAIGLPYMCVCLCILCPDNTPFERH